MLGHFFAEVGHLFFDHTRVDVVLPARQAALADVFDHRGIQVRLQQGGHQSVEFAVTGSIRLVQGVFDDPHNRTGRWPVSGDRHPIGYVLEKAPTWTVGVSLPKPETRPAVAGKRLIRRLWRPVWVKTARMVSDRIGARPGIYARPIATQCRGIVASFEFALCRMISITSAGGLRRGCRWEPGCFLSGPSFVACSPRVY